MVYLYNRIPHKATNWKSPLKMCNIWLRKHSRDTSLLNDLLSLTHLSAYGCRGYLLNEAWFKDTNCSARKTGPEQTLDILLDIKIITYSEYGSLKPRELGISSSKYGMYSS